MKQTKPMPEPWEVIKLRGKDQARYIAYDGGHEMHATDEANAARIVACVNALAGMNPEAVADVVAALSLLLECQHGEYGFECIHCNGRNQVIDSARAALRALRGE